MSGLPSVQQLEKLPLRALAAYAVRSVRRLPSGLLSHIDESVIDDALSILEAVASSEHLKWVHFTSANSTAIRVVEAMMALETSKERLAALSIHSALRVAEAVLLVVGGSNRAHYAAYAARAAYASASRADVIDETTAVAVDNAAARDYEILLETLGEHETIVIGDPIDLSEQSPLGRLM